LIVNERFSVGQLVALKADVRRSGPVVEILSPVNGSYRYRVFHTPRNIRDYYEEQLEAVDTSSEPDNLLRAVTERLWLDADVFKSGLAASRLEHPQVDNLYALQAARIRYVPFQYKPLLRFLRADRPRLLIADEVGVGKTIEAGLIFKEMQARQELGNVLIVCPKALVSKWHLEMRRFDEEFRPLTSEILRYCLKEAYLDGAWPTQYSRAIAHLELLRTDDNLQGTDGSHRPGLLTLDPAPRFDLVIVDEAHHLRNPDTNSHELARFLSDASEALLFLSATPVHLGSRNLFALLSLLRPDLFQDETVFEEMVEPNRYITSALRHVRGRTPRDGWQNEAASSLGAAADTAWGRQVLVRDPRFTEWLAGLRGGAPLSDGERIRCLRDLEETHTLAHVMNRTRRRDIGRFTLRDPRTVSVPFTLEQQRFYDDLVTFRREVLSLEHDPRVARLVSDTLERQAASCLPALIPSLDGFLATGRFSPTDLSDDPDVEDTLQWVPAPLVDQARQLRTLAVSLPPGDPKLDQLLEVVEDALSADSPGKVLVFSFFLHTLAYLERNLRGSNLRVAVITGRVADDERERLRNRFRLPRTEEEAIDVLLSSEVGSEGLDYEFCDRLVNYDIPWNPMRVEQRIGRVDRYGQASDKVLIFNFITPGTVEERVFFRCFERLGIFRDTVGDLEEVLGEVVEDLSRAALDPTLTPEQAEERAMQTADNAIRLVEEQRRLEEASGSILGLDHAFVEEVDTLVEEGRFVAPDDLRTMVTGFLNSSDVSGSLSPEAERDRVYRLRIGKDGRAKLLQRVRALRRQDRPTLAFSRWLDGSEQYLSVTFDRAVALDDRDIPFVTPMHPLSRVASHHWTSMEEPLASHLLVQDKSLPEGRYVFACDLWETVAVKPEVRMVGFAWDLDNDRPASEVSAALLRLLVRASKPENVVELDPPVAEEAFRQLDAEAYRQRQERLRELREQNTRLAEQKMASLDAYYQNRLGRVAAEAAQANDTRIARMKEAEKDRVERDYEQRRAEINDRSEADIVSDRVAAGILEVRRGE
jgi:ATP-dependent helicase HepA